MARVTHYDSLGVSRTATAEEIKAAYRKLVKRSHPDGGGTGGLFKTVQEAYEVLIDPVRRAEYDDQLAGGWPEESVASDSESGARRHPRGRQSSGGAQSFNAYSDIGKPHFRIEPPSVMAEVIDPRYPIARFGLRLVQVSGRPYDVRSDVIGFTLKPPYNRATITGLEIATPGPPLELVVTLDLRFVHFHPGESLVGTVNVRGDPGASCTLVISMARQPLAPAAGAYWVPYARFATPKLATSGAANVSIAMGVVGIVLALVPYINLLALVVAVLAIASGASGIWRASQPGGIGKGRAIAGLILGLITFVVASHTIGMMFDGS